MTTSCRRKSVSYECSLKRVSRRDIALQKPVTCKTAFGAGVLCVAAILQLVPRLASGGLREPWGERARHKPQAEEEGPPEGQIQAPVHGSAHFVARRAASAHAGLCQSSQQQQLQRHRNVSRPDTCVSIVGRFDDGDRASCPVYPDRKLDQRSDTICENVCFGGGSDLRNYLFQIELFPICLLSEPVEFVLSQLGNFSQLLYFLLALPYRNSTICILYLSYFVVVYSLLW